MKLIRPNIISSAGRLNNIAPITIRTQILKQVSHNISKVLINIVEAVTTNDYISMLIR